MDLGSLPDILITTQMARDSLPPSHIIKSHISGSVRTTHTFIGLQQRAKSITDTISEIDNLLVFRKRDFFKDYRAVVLRHQDDVTPRYDLHHMTNGIVASLAHRYIIAQDYQTGMLNSFWARQSYSLRSKINPDTHDPEFIDHECRYHWGTYTPDTPKSIIETSIEKHVQGITRFDHTDMTGHGGDFSDIYPNPDNLKVYGNTNDRYGVSVHQLSKDMGGGWLLKLSIEFEKSSDNSGFVDIDNFSNKRAFLKAIISNGTPFEVYPTEEEALANMYMMKKQRSQMVWNAANPSSLSGFKTKSKLLATTSKAFTTSYSFLFKQLKDPENKQEAVWDIIMTVIAAIVARTAVFAYLPIAITFAIAMNFGNRKAMNFAFKGLAQNIDYLFRGPKAIVGHEAEFVADNLGNMFRRFNRKPNISKTYDLIVLVKGKLDLTRQDSKQKSPREINKAIKELCSHGSTAYSRDAHLIDNNTSTDITFNGVARLVRFNRETGAIETYVKYIEALDINPKISISQEAKDLLKDGKIVKITQPKGKKTIISKDVSFNKMRDQIKDELCNNVKDSENKKKARKAAFGHISWLFNNKNHTLDETRPYVLTAMQRIDIPEPVKDIITPNDRLIAAKRNFGLSSFSIESPTQELISFCKAAIFPIQSLAIE